MREIRADLNRRLAQASAATDAAAGQEEQSRALLDAVMHFAMTEVATMPRDEAIKALEDIRSGRVVIALYMAEGETRVKFNPPKEIEWSFR